MNEHVSNPAQTETHAPANQLVERLDTSIGEMSTVMGAMMSELVRRALRGSVRQIDDELKGQVNLKVDATIAERLPAVEQAAAEAAEKAAREAATEVAVEEVRALEQRAKETEQQIVTRIENTARAAEQHALETAGILTDKIAAVERNAELAITSKAQELTGRIEDTAKTVTTMTEDKARELGRHIEEAERRANDAAHANMARQVDDLLQRSKKAAAGLKERLAAVEATAGELDRRLQALTRELEKHEQKRWTAEEQLRDALVEARRRSEALAARVTELARPRGLRALWGRLFGRRQAPAALPPAADADATVVDAALSGRDSTMP